MADPFTFEKDGETFVTSPSDMLADIARLQRANYELVESDAHANRVEALRAASRVVAGMDEYDMDGNAPAGQIDYKLTTLRLAEQFARWLEDGRQ